MTTPEIANAIAVILVAIATALAHWRVGKHAKQGTYGVNGSHRGPDQKQ